VNLGLNFGGNAMSPQLSELTDQALALPPEDRLTLAELLWVSLDEHVEEGEVDEELMAEIDRRDAEMESGAVQTFSHEEVMEAARKAIDER
jgi:putative addiction module component (TIGR02574 family)